jgi:hypothetical protein
MKPSPSDQKESAYLIRSSVPDAIPENTPGQKVPSQEQTELFWESSEYHNMSYNGEESLLSFGRSSINSEALSWAENSHAGEYPHSLDLGMGKIMDADVLEEFSNTQDVNQIFSGPLLGISDQFVSQNMPSTECSDDPFMGWARQRTNQMCEDYGWVLSHVETL